MMGTRSTCTSPSKSCTTWDPPPPANQPQGSIFTHLELLYSRGLDQKNHLQKVSCWSSVSQQEPISKVGTSLHTET